MCGKGRGKEDEEAPSGSTASYLDFYCGDKLDDYMQLREEKGSFSLYFQITAHPGGSQGRNSGRNLVKDLKTEAEAGPPEEWYLLTAPRGFLLLSYIAQTTTGGPAHSRLGAPA